jgi:hypothetical protein
MGFAYCCISQASQRGEKDKSPALLLIRDYPPRHYCRTSCERVARARRGHSHVKRFIKLTNIYTAAHKESTLFVLSVLSKKQRFDLLIFSLLSVGRDESQRCFIAKIRAVGTRSFL